MKHERYKLDGAEKEVANEIKSIEDICGCDELKPAEGRDIEVVFLDDN
jgi:hypothetical protein